MLSSLMLQMQREEEIRVCTDRKRIDLLKNDTNKAGLELQAFDVILFPIVFW